MFAQPASKLLSPVTCCKYLFVIKFNTQAETSQVYSTPYRPTVAWDPQKAGESFAMFSGRKAGWAAGPFLFLNGRQGIDPRRCSQPYGEGCAPGAN